MAVNLELSFGNLESPYCFSTFQQLGQDIVAAIVGQISGNFSGVIISANAPAVTDQDKAWFRIDSSGRPTNPFIFLYKGQWLAPHPKAPSSSERIIWTGSEAALWSHDGGDGTDPSSSAPTIISGAMWQRDTNFDFAFPVGIGTNATAYDSNPATSIAVGGTGGEERHKLTGDEFVDKDHKHVIGKLDNAGQIDLYLRNETATPALTGNAYRVKGNGTEATQDFSALNKQDVVTSGVNNPPTAIVSHQNLPPFRGVIFAKRTARQFFAAT